MADEGLSLRQACQQLGISKPFVLDWLKEDEVFATQYEYAREQLLEFQADNILTIADGATPETAQAARLQVDARKWLLSKLLPKKYGDKPADISVSTVVHNHISADRQKELQERRAKALAR